MASVLTIHEGRTDASPEAVGMNTERLGLMDRHFAKLIETGKLQGASYLVARDGKIVVHKSQGKLTPKPDSPDLMPDSLRKVYSITKALTAVAITQLCEEGKIYPTQPVCSILPEFDTNYHRGISIWNLVTHTSGLAPDPGVLLEPYPIPWYGWAIRERKQKAEAWTSSEWIRMILAGRPICKPGEQWNYCTSGYAVLGEIVARVSGMTYEEYIQKKIAKPLGMTRTCMSVPEQLRGETCYTGQWEESGIFEPAPHDEDMPPPAGNGYYSTLEDLWKFGQAMLDGGSLNGTAVLGRRSVRMMLTDHLENVPSRCWGSDSEDHRFAFGWGLGGMDICSPSTFSHEGYGHSGLCVDPQERLVYVFFVPNKEGWVPEAVIHPKNIVWSALL